MSEVYPFNMSKGKVYRLDDHITYVKASYGGTQIDSNWTGQELNELYRLNNPEEEKILSDRFISEGSTIIDTQTYLVWDNFTDMDANWANANSYCEGLVSDSYEDWRLPTFDELYSIYNIENAITHTYEEFTSLTNKAFGYWSSNTTTILVMNWYTFSYEAKAGATVLMYESGAIRDFEQKYEMNLMCVQQL